MAVVSGGGETEEFFHQKGIKTYRFPIRKKSILDPSLYFSLQAIADLIRREKYDILHAHTRVTQALAFFLGKMTGVPVVTTCHGFFKNNLGRKLFPFWGERVVAISQPVADELQSLHRVPTQKICVIHNALDLENSQRLYLEKNPGALRQKFSIPPGAFVISAMGRLVEDKGHQILIQALSRLHAAYPEAYALIVGDGRERERLEQAIQGMGLAGKVQIIPSLQDVSEILAITDIFVHPAFHREGFGLGIAEAMAVGKPVVITDIPAINTLFKPGECSVMAKPADSTSLTGAIHFLMEAPQERQKIALAGQKFVQSLCSLERQAREMETIYQELAKS